MGSSFRVLCTTGVTMTITGRTMFGSGVIGDVKGTGRYSNPIFLIIVILAFACCRPSWEDRAVFSSISHSHAIYIVYWDVFSFGGT